MNIKNEYTANYILDNYRDSEVSRVEYVRLINQLDYNPNDLTELKENIIYEEKYINLVYLARYLETKIPSNRADERYIEISDDFLKYIFSIKMDLYDKYSKVRYKYLDVIPLDELNLKFYLVLLKTVENLRHWK